MTALSQSPDMPARVLTVADRVTRAEARRYFHAGGAVLVSEYGHDATYPVTFSTTFHTRETTAWAALLEHVNEWRHRYPSQRFYILRPSPPADLAAELTALLHALSRTVFNTVVCGGSELQLADSDTAAYAHTLALLLASSIALHTEAPGHVPQR